MLPGAGGHCGGMREGRFRDVPGPMCCCYPQAGALFLGLPCWHLPRVPSGTHSPGSARDFHPGDLPVPLLTQDRDLLAQACEQRQ